MLRTQDFSLLIAITEHRLRFNHRTISNKFVLSFQTWCQRWFFFIIYNTFSYPGGKNRKWRDELLNWKCLQFYQPKLIILQNTCNYWCDIFICIIKNIVFFFFKQPPHLCKNMHSAILTLIDERNKEGGLFLCMQGQLSNVAKQIVNCIG